MQHELMKTFTWRLTLYFSDDVDRWQHLTFHIVDIDGCQSSPCLHGTCQDHPNGYTCTCSHGYTGTDCDTGI
jgi:hypothetical protein